MNRGADGQKPDPAADPVSVCVACAEPIRPAARICPRCRSSQSPQRWAAVATAVKWIGLTATVVSLIIGVNRLQGLYTESRDRQEAVAKLVQAARGLGEEGEYKAAWNTYDQALELLPGSAAVRSGRTELAMQWLLNVVVTGGETFTSIADPLIPVLHLGLVDAEETRASKITAHLAYAYYLKHRDLPLNAERVDELYTRALEHDPEGVHANTLFAHWLLLHHERVDEAQKHFRAALDTGEEREWVREMQLLSLNNPIHRRRVPTDATSPLSRVPEQILLVANEMRVNGELRPSPERCETILRSYGQGYKGEYVERLLAILDPAEQLATAAWLNEDAEHKTDAGRNQYRFVIARLTEASGDPETALTLFQELGEEEFFFKELNSRVDLAIERLTGEAPPRLADSRKRKYRDDPIGDQDPLEFHTETLLNFYPTSLSAPNVQAAFEFFFQIPEEKAQVMLTAFEGSRDHVKQWIDAKERNRQRIGSYTGSYTLMSAEAAQRTYWFMCIYVGQAATDAGQFDQAIAELGDVEAQLPDDESLKYEVLEQLAAAYSMRSATGSGSSRKADQDRVFETLAQAVSGRKQGFTVGWEFIKEDDHFKPVRDDPRYVELIKGR